MHDLKHFVENINLYKENFEKRGSVDSSFDSILKLSEQRKELIQESEEKRALVKTLSKQIGPLKKAGESADELMAEVARAKIIIESSESTLNEITSKINDILSRMPNLISEDVPVGTDEESNVEVSKWGEPKKFDFDVKDHHDLGETLGMLDFERGARLTGSRFVVYKGQLAKLERALINFFLDQHEEAGYEEAIPPYIVNRETMYGTGQLPKFEEDLFKLNDERDWFLIPTAEVPLTNLKRNELFEASELPLKYSAFTPCFRSEAGSYGKDTRGLMRLHQFNKVEMVNIVSTEDSEKAHEAMVNQATMLLEKLGLPYRKMLLCSGDIGFGARKCFDLEVWIPSQEKYREISSISNCWDFQARRAKIRYRGEDGKPKFAHTLNGSGLAVGRTVLAIMENYQNEDGSITVPEVLVPYMGGKTKISKK
jgi:seryl-tRNA synthetase